MKQDDLIRLLLDSPSGVNLVTSLMAMDTEPLRTLEANPEVRAAFADLPEEAKFAIADELIGIEAEANMSGFKTGFDLAMTLTGNRPVYGALPDRIDPKSAAA